MSPDGWVGVGRRPAEPQDQRRRRQADDVLADVEHDLPHRLALGDLAQRPRRCRAPAARGHGPQKKSIAKTNMVEIVTPCGSYAPAVTTGRSSPTSTRPAISAERRAAARRLRPRQGGSREQAEQDDQASSPQKADPGPNATSGRRHRDRPAVSRRRARHQPRLAAAPGARQAPPRPISCVLVGAARAVSARSPRPPSGSGRRRRPARPAGGPAASGPCSSSTRNAVLVQDRHAQLTPPCRTSSPGSRPPPRSRSSSRPSRTTLPPRAWIGLRRPVAGEALERAGHDDGEALERPRSLVDRVLLQPDPGRAPLARRSPGASRPRTTRARASAITGPTPSTAASSLLAAATIASIDPKLAGQRLRGGRPDVADRQRDQHPPQRTVLGRLEVVEQLACRWPISPPSLQAEQLDLRRARPRRGRRRRPRPARTPGVEQARPRPRSRAPRCRTRRARPGGTAARAAGPGRSGCWGSGCRRRPPSPGQRRAARRGRSVGITNARSDPSRSVDDRPDDLGDDVAGLAQHDRVADQHALALDL